jgi:hypothetical protein
MASTEEFKQVLVDAGIPITDEEIKKAWDTIVVEQGFEVKNNSPFSPFWRLIKAIASTPALQVTDVLATTIMPNSFVLSAENQWLDKHGASRNTPRLGAIKAQGNVQITRIDTAGELVIPAGTVIQSSPINNIIYQLITMYDTTFIDGEAVQSALAEATKEGGDHNLTGGYFNQLTVPVDGVSVVNLDNWLVRAGQDIESDDNYQLRIRDKFATLGNYHVDAVYRAIISEFPGILAHNIVFDKNIPRGPGSATAYVHLTVGIISQAVIDEVNNHISSGYHGNGDDMLVMAMPTQVKDITLNYWLKPNSADVKADIENFIRAAFRENSAYEVTTCAANSTFSFSLLTSELHKQFPQIKTLKFINDDFNTDFWLPVIGTLNVNKQT